MHNSGIFKRHNGQTDKKKWICKQEADQTYVPIWFTNKQHILCDKENKLYTQKISSKTQH